MIDRDLLAKILARTTSATDAEALTAIRKAKDLLAKEGTTWQEVLGEDTVRVARPFPTRPVSPPARTSRSIQRGPVREPDRGEDFLHHILSDFAYNFARGMRGLPPRRPR